MPWPAARRVLVHPNGFLQVAFDEHRDARLHIWPDRAGPEIPRQRSRHPVHNHSHDLTSTVLRGAIFNWRVGLRRLHEGRTRRDEYRVYQVRQVGRGDTVLLEPTPLYAQGIVRTCEEVLTGASYSLRAAEFHESVPGGFTVTWFERGEKYDFQPQVLVSVGEEALGVDNAFRRGGAPERVLRWWVDRAKEELA